MKRLLLIIVGGAAFVGALWAGWELRANNSTSIDLDLIWIRIPNLELWWLLLLAMAFGGLIAGLIVGFSLMRNKIVLRRTRKQVKKLEKEVHELRSLPLVGSEPGGGNLDTSHKSLDSHETAGTSNTKPSATAKAAKASGQAIPATPLSEKS